MGWCNMYPCLLQQKAVSSFISAKTMRDLVAVGIGGNKIQWTDDVIHEAVMSLCCKVSWKVRRSSRGGGGGGGEIFLGHQDHRIWRNWISFWGRGLHQAQDLGCSSNSTASSSNCGRTPESSPGTYSERL